MKTMEFCQYDQDGTWNALDVWDDQQLTPKEFRDYYGDGIINAVDPCVNWP